MELTVKFAIRIAMGMILIHLRDNLDDYIMRGTVNPSHFGTIPNFM